MTEEKPRPNILFITSDQQRGDCYGFRGRKVQTPHLDLLASEGTSLETVVTPCVVCQPARASILTGLLPRTHGVHDNGIDLDPELGEKGFAGSLSAAGYHTAKIGKAHFATYHVFGDSDTVESIPGSARVPAGWRGPYMGFDHAELVHIGHNWWLPEEPPAGLAYEEWYYGDGRGAWKNKLLWESARDHKGAPQTWSSKLPVAWHNSTWIADRTVDFLRQDHGKPFCLWVSFPDPHHPFDCPEPWASLHRPEDVDLPEHRTRDFEGRPWWHQAAVETEIPAEHAEIRAKYSRLAEMSDAHLREVIANTYGQLALIDHSVGRILAELEAQGLADNTYIVYTADHGDWLGDHGLVLKGPMPFEGLLNVKAIVKGPDVPVGRVSHEPLSTLDLGATFMDWAGADSLMDTHGRSMRDVISGEGSRDGALSEWELLPGRVGVGLSLRTVRSKTAKLTMDLQSGAGEMYDLAADPQELHNLFDNPDHARLQADLTDILMSRPDDIQPNRVPVGMA
ncbi:sulfatase-like hydrolase/transferase [Marinovum algicola]|uniref:sulfatase-like hydrolase/transferase n=1 Tax=Marinovum algicola TaxID=42444 RepID=UPI0024BAD430|nr:sulfatase-like hydrolase/transferase [Marinovum algicola]